MAAAFSDKLAHVAHGRRVVGLGGKLFCSDPLVHLVCIWLISSSAAIKYLHAPPQACLCPGHMSHRCRGCSRQSQPWSCASSCWPAARQLQCGLTSSTMPTNLRVEISVEHDERKRKNEGRVIITEGRRSHSVVTACERLEHVLNPVGLRIE